MKKPTRETKKQFKKTKFNSFLSSARAYAPARPREFGKKCNVKIAESKNEIRKILSTAFCLNNFIRILFFIFLFNQVVLDIHAGENASINLRITVAPVLSVDVDSSDYDFGLLPANTSSISTRPITVINDSAGRTEDFSLSASNSNGGWIIDSTNGVDTFSLQALSTGSARPSDSDFTNVMSTLSPNPTQWNSNTNHYSFSGSTFTGNNVQSGQTRKLWFRILTPASTSLETEQTTTVTVTANSASTF